MEKYVQPTIIEETLEVVDIIAVSNGGDGNGANEVSANDLWA